MLLLIWGWKTLIQSIEIFHLIYQKVKKFFIFLSNLVIEPKYLFFQQLFAVFLRKYYMTVRNWNTMFMFCFPIIFIIVGVLIGKALIKQDMPVLKIDC